MTVLDLPRPQPKPAEPCWTIVLAPRDGARALQAETMTAAEQMFFFGAPLAHVVEYEEQLKVLRREQAARRLARARKPFDAIPGLAPQRELCEAGAGQ
jgi:hypothetical protein